MNILRKMRDLGIHIKTTGCGIRIMMNMRNKKLFYYDIIRNIYKEYF